MQSRGMVGWLDSWAFEWSNDWIFQVEVCFLTTDIIPKGICINKCAGKIVMATFKYGLCNYEDGWFDDCMDGWLDGWMVDGWMVGWLDG